MSRFLSEKTEEGCRGFLAAINACFICGIFLLCYDGDTTWLLILVGVFLAIANKEKERFIKWFRNGISLTAHSLIFAILTVVTIMLVLPNWYEKKQKL